MIEIYEKLCDLTKKVDSKTFYYMYYDKRYCDIIGTYKNIIYAEQCKKHIGYYNEKMYEELRVLLLKIWIDNLFWLSKEELIEIRKTNLKLSVLIEHIFKISNEFNTYQEFLNSIDYELYEKLLKNEEFYKSFRLVMFKEDYCNKIRSSGLSKYKNVIKEENIKHRLYLNTEPTDTDKICYYFLLKCIKRKLPFDLKFDGGNGKRNDSIVIYTDTENIGEYIQILKEIQEEHIEIKFYPPSVFAGVIDEFIGYGSEKERYDEYGTRESFSSIRTKIYVDAINEAKKITSPSSKTFFDIVDDCLKKELSKYGLEYSRICFEKESLDELILYKEKLKLKEIANELKNRSPETVLTNEENFSHTLDEYNKKSLFNYARNLIAGIKKWM